MQDRQFFSGELQQSFHCRVRLEAVAGATNRGFSQCVTHSRGISVCVTVSLCSVNNVSLVTVIQTSPVDQPLRHRAPLAGDWSGDLRQSRAICHAVYLQGMSARGPGGARRLRSAPDSADARARTSPHSSVYFLNRPLFGLTSVVREYLRKRGRKSVENKGRGRQLSAIEPSFSLFLIRAELQSAWRHRNRPSRQLGSRRDWRGGAEGEGMGREEDWW